MTGLKVEVGRWRQIREVLGEALDLPPAERHTFLEKSCEGDPSLLQEVLALLTAAEDESNPLDQPPDLSAFLPPDPQGQRVGPYRILRELGRGGMGVVYLAERADQAFDKKVALKVLRWGRLTSEAVARFRQERQILADLAHPNIARLLDGGTTTDGTPYLVMEYVEGIPIDVWCRQQQLPLAARLELMVKVCDAVAHAHRNLVVHRDLKPGNILVGSDGIPHLLDFGIAKVLATDHVEAVTITGERAMTARYASPEQVRGTAITTLTDVYTLGVILYELLAGRRPTPAHEVDPFVLARLLTDSLPPPPSVTASTLPPDSLPIPPLRWARALGGDVDTMVLKALAVEPSRRYSSAEQLASDLANYLKGLPIYARRESTSYRVRHFLKRNRVVVSGVFLFLLLLVGSLVALSLQAHRLAQERDRAARIAEVLEGVLNWGTPAESRGRVVSARELLDRSSVRIQEQLEQEPTLRAKLVEVIVGVYLSLGEYEAAQRLTHAELGRLAVAGEDKGREAANLVRRQGEILRVTAQFDEAEVVLKQALLMQQRLRPRQPLDVVETLAQQAYLAQARGDFSRALGLRQVALEMRQAEQGDVHLDVARSWNDVGVAYDQLGRYPEAERSYAEGIRVYRALGRERSPEMAALYNNLGATLAFMGRPEDAVHIHTEALAIRLANYGAIHPTVARSFHNLANVRHCWGQWELAHKLGLAEWSIRREVFGPNHPETLRARSFQIELAVARLDLSLLPEAEEVVRQRRELLGDEHPDTARSLGWLGLLILGGSRPELAGPPLHQAHNTFKRVVLTAQMDRAPTLVGLGELAMREGKPAQAELYLREVVALWEKVTLDMYWWLAIARVDLGICLLAQGKRQEATPLLEEGTAVMINLLGAEHPWTKRAVRAHSGDKVIPGVLISAGADR